LVRWSGVNKEQEWGCISQQQWNGRKESRLGKGRARCDDTASLKHGTSVKKWTSDNKALNSSNGRNDILILADMSEYRPSEKETFMNELQREYFRAKLLSWRVDILKEAKDTLQNLQDENQNHADFADRASSETDRAIELRARDRQRKLIAKIDAALQRIEDGTYGYCEDTGEPIGLKRLEARPIATLSVEAQERHERQERIYSSG
jgi:DnaK suppressor protein